MSAALGLDATGIDVAETPIEISKAKARNRNLMARFLVHDARHLPALGEQFDTVIDCGLFHIFDKAERAAFELGLRSVVKPSSRIYMLCLSDHQTNYATGTTLVSQEDIRDTFGTEWLIDSIELSTLDSMKNPERPAWLATITPR
jgi:2-polyprenyl-3-methyl-5-hydroxy-6-metoxy-1,4-benzoquinol methylase